MTRKRYVFDVLKIAVQFFVNFEHFVVRYENGYSSFHFAVALTQIKLLRNLGLNIYRLKISPFMNPYCATSPLPPLLIYNCSGPRHFH